MTWTQSYRDEYRLNGDRTFGVKTNQTPRAAQHYVLLKDKILLEGYILWGNLKLP